MNKLINMQSKEFLNHINSIGSQNANKSYEVKIVTHDDFFAAKVLEADGMFYPGT